MRIAVVDDNKDEQERLSGYIAHWAKNCGESVITDVFGSGEDFARALDGNTFDVVFMDIIMEGQSGIDAAKRLREQNMDTLLIFITSSPEFMTQAFPCHAFDYVMKPYTDQRITEVLGEVRRVTGKHSTAVEIAGEKFLLSDILYAYSDSNYCEIYTKHGRRRVRIPFSELSGKLLQYPSFMVVNRGMAVNFDNTSHISEPDCVMVNGDRVPVSRRKIKEVEKGFLDRQFSRLLEEGK